MCAVCSREALVQKLQKSRTCCFSRWYSSGMTREKRMKECVHTARRVTFRMSLSACASYCCKGVMPVLKKKLCIKHYMRIYYITTWTDPFNLKLYTYLSNSVLQFTCNNGRVDGGWLYSLKKTVNISLGGKSLHHTIRIVQYRSKSKQSINVTYQ